jgi:hypothetical protein
MRELWSQSILANGLASVEKEWVQHEEGMCNNVYEENLLTSHKNESSQRQP